jgi:hypothetical protein
MRRLGFFMLPEIFLEWVQKNQKRLLALGIHEIETSKNPDWNNPSILHSARAIFWTNLNAGDVTIWQAGHFDILVYNANSDLLFSDSMFLETEKTEGNDDGIGRKKIVITDSNFDVVLSQFFQELITNQP